jgi:sugar phosphate isomerase/epimerase
MLLTALPYHTVQVGELSTADWFRAAAEYRLDGLDLMDAWLNDEGQTLNAYDHVPSHELRRVAFKPAVARRLHVELADCPVKPAILTIHNNLFRLDPAAQEHEVDRVEECALVADAFGIATMRVQVLGWDERRPEVPAADAIAAVVDVTSACLERCPSFTFMFENQPGLTLTRDRLATIFEQIDSPRAGLNLDCKNATLAGEHPVTFLDDPRIGPRVRSFHLNDFRHMPGGGWDLSLALGDGELDYGDTFPILKRMGYRHWMSVIYDGSDLDDVRRSVAWVRAQWEAA